jgi:predicted DNA-binding antitoxin AbrB/MazE fold protein
MIAVNGVYENGVVRLDTKIKARKSSKVIVTFLDEEMQNKSKRLSTKDFSFLVSREKSKRYKGSLSDSVIEDRKAEL